MRRRWVRDRRSTRRRFRFGALGLVVALAATGVASSGVAGATSAAGPDRATPTAASSVEQAARCLLDHRVDSTVRGFQTERYTTDIPAGAAVDALGALWLQTATYPVSFGGGAGGCWLGGAIVGTYAQSTPWSTFHHTTGLAFTNGDFTISGVRVHNIGDGIGVRTGADGFTITGAHLSFIHDDCIQNDELYTGVVEDSLLDGCYVAFSARPTKGDSVDGHDNTETFRGNVVRLEPMPTVYKGRAPGNGGFFKWDDHGRSPKLVVEDNVFRVDQRPNHQTLGLPAGYRVQCSKNVVVWLGKGRYPDKLPKCFRVTRDRTVWDRALAAWHAAHPLNP
jgi:hypothetical protein